MKKYFILLLLVFLFVSCEQKTQIRFSTTVSSSGSSTETNVFLDRDIMSLINDGDVIHVKNQLVDSKGMIQRTVEVDYSVSDIVNGVILHDFKYFGKHIITVDVVRRGAVIAKVQGESILTAPEYNIAVLTATLPNSIMTLGFVDKSNSTIIDSSIPTIVALERAKAYNWDYLPKNMIALPFTSFDKVTSSNTTSGNYIGDFEKDMNSYIKYLHELNSDSVFNIYMNDYHFYMLFMLLENTGVKIEDLGKIVALSDGTGSYWSIRKEFGAVEDGENPSLALYDILVERWESLKKAIADGSDWAKIYDPVSSDRDAVTCSYMPVLLEDKSINFEWYVNRDNIDTFGSSNVYIEHIKGKVKTVNLNSLLSSLDKSETDTLKNLFHLDLDQFIEADKSGKTPMIFLGTRWATESEHLKAYLDFMIQYFGDNFAYYYKGHPGDPTEFRPERASVLEEVGTINLDCSIAAEFFLFFRPDAVPVGYGSTTFIFEPESFVIPFLTNTLSETYVGSDSSRGVGIAMAYDKSICKYHIINHESKQETFWNIGDDISTLVWTDIS